MRDYSIVAPQFWTGETGRLLRDDPEAQRIALYLLTCPNSNMIGLYYLPLPTLCHEVGSPLEGASKALQRLSSMGFAFYDEVTEVVFVVNMAKFQIGESLSARDNRIISIKKELLKFHKCRFYQDFVKIYSDAYHLSDGEPLESPSQAPSKPLRSQDQDQDQEQEQSRSREPSSARQPARARNLDLDLDMPFGLFPEKSPEAQCLKHIAGYLKPTKPEQVSGLIRAVTWTRDTYCARAGPDGFNHVVRIAKDCARAHTPVAAFYARMRKELGYEAPTADGGHFVCEKIR